MHGIRFIRFDSIDLDSIRFESSRRRVSRVSRAAWLQLRSLAARTAALRAFFGEADSLSRPRPNRTGVCPTRLGSSRREVGPSILSTGPVLIPQQAMDKDVDVLAAPSKRPVHAIMAGSGAGAGAAAAQGDAPPPPPSLLAETEMKNHRLGGEQRRRCCCRR